MQARCDHGFSRHGKIYRDERKEAKHPNTRGAGVSSHTGPVALRSEFSPAIPRRVAPQQSPLPLRRLSVVYPTDSRGRKASLDPKKSVSHVSERLSAMSPVQTPLSRPPMNTGVHDQRTKVIPPRFVRSIHLPSCSCLRPLAREHREQALVLEPYLAGVPVHWWPGQRPGHDGGLVEGWWNSSYNTSNQVRQIFRHVDVVGDSGACNDLRIEAGVHGDGEVTCEAVVAERKWQLEWPQKRVGAAMWRSGAMAHHALPVR